MRIMKPLHRFVVVLCFFHFIFIQQMCNYCLRLCKDSFEFYELANKRLANDMYWFCIQLNWIDLIWIDEIQIVISFIYDLHEWKKNFNWKIIDTPKREKYFKAKINNLQEKNAAHFNHCIEIPFRDIYKGIQIIHNWLATQRIISVCTSRIHIIFIFNNRCHSPSW